MTKNSNGEIISMHTLDDQAYKAVTDLERLCLSVDGTSLKLELAYKKSMGEDPKKVHSSRQLNEFLCYVEGHLVGYVGICGFDGVSLEVSGMVHPDYRRRGIFTELVQCVKEECLKRPEKVLLILTDERSEAGNAFVKTMSGRFDHSEHEMFLRGTPSLEMPDARVRLYRATNEDADEIASQNCLYFRDEEAEESHEDYKRILPEEEAKGGMVIFMAAVGDDIIGKVHVQVNGTSAGIYGVGVKPNQRRQGYGREILMKAIIAAKEMGCDEVMLQVATKNGNALDLYTSCGFEVTSTMTYFVIEAEDQKKTRRDYGYECP